ncbi:DUF1349 domain-containing protein, partial [Myxococcus xanthus]
PAKAGLMLRNDASAGSAYVGVFVSATGGISFQRRATAGGSTTITTVATTSKAPIWLRLGRVGNAFSAFYSTDGTTWIQVGAAATVALNTNTMIGMAATSGNKTQLSTATFSNVGITI